MFAINRELNVLWPRSCTFIHCYHNLLNISLHNLSSDSEGCDITRGCVCGGILPSLSMLVLTHEQKKMCSFFWLLTYSATPFYYFIGHLNPQSRVKGLFSGSRYGFFNIFNTFQKHWIYFVWIGYSFQDIFILSLMVLWEKFSASFFEIWSYLLTLFFGTWQLFQVT